MTESIRRQKQREDASTSISGGGLHERGWWDEKIKNRNKTKFGSEIFKANGEAQGNLRKQTEKRSWICQIK